MDREELKTKINAALGSTKLTLSERTINDFLDDALVGITDDAAINDDFVTRKANMLKSIDGNLHSDVSEQVKKYKETVNPAPVSEEPKKQETVEKPAEVHDDGGVAKELEALKARLQSFEDARKKADEDAQRESEKKELKEAFEARFKDAGVGVNGYVLRQTLRDFKGSGSVDDKVKALEGKYYENLKEAGFDFDGPRIGGMGSNPNSVQSRRDALKNELRSRGMLPKQEQQ